MRHEEVVGSSGARITHSRAVPVGAGNRGGVGILTTGTIFPASVKLSRFHSFIVFL